MPCAEASGAEQPRPLGIFHRRHQTGQDGYTTLYFEASYPFLKYFTISAFARNVLDEDYQERFGYPAAGANYVVVFTAKF